MKLKALILLCLAVVTSASAQTRIDTLLNRLHSPADGTVMVVAHRGDWRYAPENSIAAIEHCIDLGVDIVELDLQLTQDSVLIVMHDATLNRTTNGKGKISETPMDSIRKLQLKNGCGIKTLHKVPTLEEAMLAAKGKILVNLDKADTYFDLLLPILQKTGTARQVIMKSDRKAQDVKDAFGEGYKEVVYMPKVNFSLDGSDVALADAMTLNAPIYELKYDVEGRYPDAAAGTKKLHKNARIWYNTLWASQCGGHDDEVALTDCDASFGFLIDDLKADVIQTDRVQLLLDYLRSRGLHE